MHEDINQKISQFLDDELNQDDALVILQKMQLKPDLKNKLNRYEAISHVLKTDVFLYPDPDFTTKVSQQVQQEPFYLLPRNQLSNTEKQGSKINKMLALAASIAVVAIVSTRVVNKPSDAVKTLSPTPLAQEQSTNSSINIASDKYRDERYPLNSRINDYLQAHNSSVYTNGEANFRPFATVSAQSQE
jgi:sigma-E factor negative regulatory protein RseA